MARALKKKMRSYRFTDMQVVRVQMHSDKDVNVRRNLARFRGKCKRRDDCVSGCHCYCNVRVCYQKIFFEGRNSHTNISWSVSRNTTVYFFLQDTHLYPVAARPGSRHNACFLLESASFVRKSYTSSANRLAVASMPCDSIYHATSAILSATDSLTVIFRLPTSQ